MLTGFLDPEGICRFIHFVMRLGAGTDLIAFWCLTNVEAGFGTIHYCAASRGLLLTVQPELRYCFTDSPMFSTCAQLILLRAAICMSSFLAVTTIIDRAGMRAYDFCCSFSEDEDPSNNGFENS